MGFGAKKAECTDLTKRLDTPQTAATIGAPAVLKISLHYFIPMKCNVRNHHPTNTYILNPRALGGINTPQ